MALCAIVEPVKGSIMARHTIYGVGPTVFASNSPGASHRPLYLVPTEFGILNNDGTHTYFTGTGFSYDWLNGVFTGGTVTSMVHYDINGQPLDQLTSLSVPTTSLEAVFFSIAEYGSNAGPMPLNLLSGDDYIDARVRLGGAVVADYIYAGDGNDVVLGGSGNDTLWGAEGNDRLYGDEGEDTLLGDSGNDRLYGGSGNDRLIDGDGNDVLFGEDGFDTLEGSQGDDILSGGAGDDTILDQFGSNTVYGGDGNDRISVGTRTVEGASRSVIYGDGGDDFISGGTGADNIRGGAGNDNMSGGESSDAMFGDDGNDTVSGNDGADRIWGGAGADTLNGNAGADYIAGEADADTLNGGSGSDRLLGGAGADKLIGDDQDIVLSGTGRDVLFGGDGDDVLWGRGDTDSLNGDAGSDTAVYLLSTFADLKITQNATGFYVSSQYEGFDNLSGIEKIAARDGSFAWNSGTSHWDRISDDTAATVLGLRSLPSIVNGTAGDDTISWNNLPGGPPSGFSPDIYLALDGNDTITFAGFSSGGFGPSSPGQHGEAAVFGGNGNDVITVGIRDVISYSDSQVTGLFTFDGGAGNDTLTGGNEADYLIGGSGLDILRGNQGNDTLTGGSNVDTFIFTRQSLFNGSEYARQYFSFGNDVITDFVVGTDRLQISGAVNSTIADTTEGVLVTVNFYARGSYEIAGDTTTPGALISSTILLQGLHGAYGLGDLVI